MKPGATAIFSFLCLGCWPALAFAGEFPPPSTPTPPLTNPAGLLTRSIPLRWKLFAESACRTNIAPELASVVVSNVLDDRELMPPQHLGFAAAARCVTLYPRLAERGQKPNDTQGTMALCLVLGRASQHNRKFLPALQSFTTNSDPAIRLTACVALAFSGQASTAQVRQIERALQGPSDDRKDALWSLEVCAGDWLPTPLTREIERSATNGADGLERAAVIFGEMGANARMHASALETAWSREKLKIAPASSPLLEILVQAALARMRGQWDATSARPVVKLTGTLEALDLPALHLLDAICNRMLDENGITPLIQLLQDGDRDVALGAARFCFALSARARAAQPHLFAVLRKQEDSTLRREVICAIGMVGDLQAATHLRELASGPVPEAEKQAIADSISFIQNTSGISQ